MFHLKRPKVKRRAFKRWISQEFIYVLSYLHMLNILMKIPTFSESSDWELFVC